MALINEVVLVPLLSKFGIRPADPTFGRYLLHDTEEEKKHISSHSHISIRQRRVFISPSNEPGVFVKVGKGEDVELKEHELADARGKEWIFYKVWVSESEEAKKGKARGCDLVVSHGMCDYNGKWSPHVSSFLEMGFRVIAPDLAAHGRSTGTHVYLPSAFDLTEGLHAVLTDVARWSNPRKTFLAGTSLGGWTSLAYALRYPNPPSRLSGLYLMAPLIGVAPETMPPYPIYLIGIALRSFLGRLPFTPAVKGNVSDDPRVEEECYADERCYHGDLRIATGLALLEGLKSLLPSASKVDFPLHISHGAKDRATDHKRSVEFIAAVRAAAKERDISVDVDCKTWDGYEHVMLKVGRDDEDDAKRQAVLAHMREWLSDRV
ncbi:Alpha/Beta hydrolase protein [Cantharellus anzutake]|uniref:Alpha/Beta hydrolase protein n=1 Tax=Cantharellus anzutake TaxID=1750568 RepID=UPI0019033C0E|nr:Alpha/Beta hydrolase protein [Cantharellus anzutake]KAF8338157.1 Alpha/Beta hydrolase protein [Cantharellus anzutake]